MRSRPDPRACPQCGGPCRPQVEADPPTCVSFVALFDGRTGRAQVAPREMALNLGAVRGVVDPWFCLRCGQFEVGWANGRGPEARSTG